jgi:hypothetical protein
LATQIHERLRLGQANGALPNPALGHLSFAPLVAHKTEAMRPGQRLDDPEADVVTVIGVFTSGIAQADDHGR